MKPTDPPVRSVFDCNVFLQAMAIATGAHVITSRDRHLLALRDPTDPVGVDFISRFSSIEVLNPVQLLQRIRSG